jgi:hypothetical protein
MEVEGLVAGKELKLYPDGGRAWHWTETGTGIHLVSSPPTSRNY